MAVSLHTRGLAALAVLLSAAVAGCDDLLDSYDYAEITVSVQDESGNPMGNVPVLLYTSERVLDIAATDTYGRRTFPYVFMGEYGVAAIPPAGYSSSYLAPPGENAFVDGLFIGEGVRVEVPLTLTKICCGTLVAVVEEPSGAPVSGVRVTANGRDYDRALTTAEDGSVRFEALLAGEYGIVVDVPPGYVPAQSEAVDGILPVMDQETVVKVVLVRS